MDSVPDAIVQHILSQMNSALDLAAYSCVSRRWKESVPYLPSPYFPRNAFEGVPPQLAAAALDRMITAASRLEELVVYCPFSAPSLASWLSLHCRSLQRLELRMDSIAEQKSPSAPAKLDCLARAWDLETLKLWGVSLAQPPKWGGGVFQRLHTLEVVGAVLEDHVLPEVLRACPSLRELALLGCEGSSAASIVLDRLEICRLDVLATGSCSLHVSSSRLRVLDVQGFDWIRVDPNHHLRSVSIFSDVSLFMPQRSAAVFVSAALFVLWSTRVYMGLLVELASCGDEHRGLIAYACFLIYTLFSLLVIF